MSSEETEYVEKDLRELDRKRWSPTPISTFYEI